MNKQINIKDRIKAEKYEKKGKLIDGNEGKSDKMKIVKES